MAELKSMVKVGIVSALDKEKKQLRAYFPDEDNLVSNWLHVLQRTGENLNIDEAGAHSHSGAVGSDGSHKHEGKVAGFMPKVNDKVLVLYPYGWNMDGYVLGVIP